jgi:hypothetical protein
LVKPITPRNQSGARAPPDASADRGKPRQPLTPIDCMPNPINHVPGGWLYTWLLQIVPVFFIVGGYANYASWQASRRRGQAWSGFLRHRLARLLTPVLVFGVVWLVFELAAHAIIPGYPGVLSYAWMVFTPLWFVAAYAGVVALVPVTAAMHLRAKWAATGGLAAAVIVADAGRFALDVEAFGWLNSAMVWVLIHQFGYFYRDGTLRRLDHAGAAGLVVVGAGMLAAITTLGPYPRSMVATPGQEFSNILPTTMAIAAVGLLQLGILLLVRDRVSRWLQKVEVWRVVIAANSVILAHDRPAGGVGCVPRRRGRTAGVSFARLVGPALVLAGRARTRPRSIRCCVRAVRDQWPAPVARPRPAPNAIALTSGWRT